jgi:redox-sensitive bicupin YhaK (pirin superfamily)
MELSVVRIQKAGAPGGQPWLHTRFVVHPDNYLSQCPFILLSEESHEALSEFPIHSRNGVIAATLALEGSTHRTDDIGARRELGKGDVGFSIGRGDVLQNTAGDAGVRLLHLWINLPASLKAESARHEVVRHDEARRVTFGDASAVLYAGTLGETSGPYTSPWPLAIADVTLQAGKSAKLPLASNERSFVYVLRGNLELGRNRVRLAADNVAWLERTVRPGGINSATVRATRDSRLLVFSSSVFGDDASLPDDNTNCASDLPEGL